MSEGATFSVGALCVAAVFLGLIGASLFGCQKANQQYYDMARHCTDTGGSFVPIGRGTYDAICISQRAEAQP